MGTDADDPPAPTAPGTASDGERTVDDSGGRRSRPSMPPSRSLGNDRYQLSSELGHGGMGEVIAARDEQIGREVAIKRMREPAPSDRAVARFMREARIQGRLEHPAIPPVHELGRDVDGRPYFAMKRLSGTTLSDLLDAKDPKYTPQRLLRAFADVCLAVEFAHTRGVIHRDLKPDNIMLGEFGEVYVLDWGVAKLRGEALDEDEGYEGSDSAANATAVGLAVGTPGYMAPEQVVGDPNVDARADVYALGSVLFEILAGKRLHPHGAAALMSTVEGADGSPARRAPDRDIAPELDALCVAATATRRDERLATARALGEGVQLYLDGDRDVVLRCALARGHQTTALAAFERDDRSAAMREAARALALDHELNPAAELITRLMLDPPTELPAEVARELHRADDQTVSAHSRFAFWGYAGIAVYLPIVFAIAPLDQALAFAAAQLATLACAGLFAFTRRRMPIQVFVLANMLLLGVLSMIFSPLLFAPTAAALTGLVFALNPLFEPWPRATNIVLMCGAYGLPWAGELAGVLPHTFRFDASGVCPFGEGLHGGAVLTAAITASSAVIMTIVAVMVGHSIRIQEARSRRQLLVQAWQLRQLVPTRSAA